MKVLIYNNKGRDPKGELFSILTAELKKVGIEYSPLTDEKLNDDICADAIFCLGGDGTILYVNEFANRMGIPIIGINTGRLGFLCEYEKENIADAVASFALQKLKKDQRICARISFKGKEYLALNEACVQRVFTETESSTISTLDVCVDGKSVAKFRGDGVIINTPTGTSGYSLSAGGAILAPDTDVFMITPLAAHCLFMHHSIVGSSKSDYSINVVKGGNVGLYVDGKFVSMIEEGESVKLIKHECPTVFLRDNEYDFFGRLYNKLKEDVGD